MLIHYLPTATELEWRTCLEHQEMEAKRHGYRVSSFYFTKKLQSHKDLQKFIAGMGFEQLSCTYYDTGTTYHFRRNGWEDLWAGIGSGRTEIMGVLTAPTEQLAKERNDKTISSIRNFLEQNKKVFEQQEEKGKVYVLKKTECGLEFDYFGRDFAPLVRENYSDEALAAHDKVASEFSSSSSAKGFISIFSGMPGTGKSWLIRSLIGSIENGFFAYIPAGMIAELSGPALIGVLSDLSDTINQKHSLGDIFEANSVSRDGEENYVFNFENIDEKIKLKNEPEPKTNKIILILEDADEVLAPRSETQMSGISSLLNLTDGLLGKILNIRVIATTNAEATKLDHAITRPGRLLNHCIVGMLDREQAQKIYEREGGEGKLTKKFYTLAEIYALANDEECSIEEKEHVTRKIGF